MSRDCSSLPFFCLKSSRLRAAGWIRVCWLICQKYTEVWDFADDPCPACVCTQAQEILINALHSDFDRIAHMHRQEIYHSFSHSSCETENNHSVTPAQRNIGVNIQAGYKKDFSHVCCPWICVSVCARWRMPGISHDILLSVL